MGQVLIRNLDDAILTDYRRAAKDHGRSLEAELREALARARPVVAAPHRDELIARMRAVRASNAGLAFDIDGTTSIRQDRDGFREA